MWVDGLGRYRQNVYGQQFRRALSQCSSLPRGRRGAVELGGNDAPASRRVLSNPLNDSTADLSREIQPRDLNKGTLHSNSRGCVMWANSCGCMYFRRCYPIQVSVWFGTESAKTARATIPADFVPMFVVVARTAASGPVELGGNDAPASRRVLSNLVNDWTADLSREIKPGGRDA